MDEFPDPEDEFDLMHEDDYEVLRELEASQCQNTVSHVTAEQKKINGIQVNNHNKLSESISSQINQEKELEVTSAIENKQYRLEKPVESSKKRTIDEILGECSSVDFDDIHQFDLQEKKKPCWNRPEQLIELILDKRKKLHSNDKKNCKKEIVQRDLSESITRRVPLHNFVAVNRSDDGERFYIKVSGKSKYKPTGYRPKSGFLLQSFQQLKSEAEDILLKQSEKASLENAVTVNTDNNTSCELWVDKYRPQRYLDLLSDESVNLSLLHWLKLWDKIVFDRDPTVRLRKPKVISKFQKKFKKNDEDVPEHDSKGFPTHRMALLAGPPGLGKTTLAHVAARHAGYNIVELNASDDRTPEAFREALLASTQMRAVLDKDNRPNCLVLDEIDGAPAASIDLLLKFIHGKLAPKGKNIKDKGQKVNDGCRRPVICICNDLYTPSLRPLRAIALIINVPEISPSTLSDRLAEIARKEGLRVDLRILLQLAERSGCDVRACLGILQYTGGKANMLQSLAFGMKDMRKGLFESWKELLKVPLERTGPLSVVLRAQKVIKIVHQGEPDRLMQGIFHNYPENSQEKLVPVSNSLQWFQFYDQVNKMIMERQSWLLMPYTMSAFVAWHLHLATTQNPKISYPAIMFEVHQKTERTMAILSITKKTSKMDILTLVSEVLPYLPDLLTPRLRSVNAQLYSPKEKSELARLVNLMLDFGLSFTQEKKPEGGYDYCLDPNLWDIGTFPNCKVRKPLSYAVKQIVIQELENTRLQRAAITTDGEVKSTTEKPPSVNKKPETPSTSKTGQNVPNHLRTLNPIEVQPKADKCRNFFRAFQIAGQEKFKQKLEKEKAEGIQTTETNSNAKKVTTKNDSDLLKSDVWYQYKEGYSNAVRRTVLMEDLL